jgi:hypothetical protein
MGIILDKLDKGALIEEQLEKEDRKRRREDKKARGEWRAPTFPPSMISKCEREIVYHLLDLPVTLITDPQLLRIFANGDDVHERIMRHLALEGCLHKYEWKASDKENRIEGSIDAVLRLTEQEYDTIDARDIPGRPYILAEFKSARTEACIRLESGKPTRKHVEQLQLYMHIKGIHKGVILVERKDDQQIFEFYIDYDPVMVGDLLYKVKYCLEHADRKELPPRGGTRRSSPCWYSKDRRPLCPYYNICWSETEGKDLII